MNLLDLVVAGLATFQLSFLLSKKEGPWSIFKRLREETAQEARHSKKLRESAVHRGIQCQHCTSVWMALPVSAFVWLKPVLPMWLQIGGDWFLLFMALATLSVIINQTWTRDS